MQTGRKTLAVLIASSTLSACGGGGGGTVGPTPPTTITTFTTWRTDVGDKAIRVDGQGKQESYTWNPTTKTVNRIYDPQDVSASAVFDFNNGVLTDLFLTSASTTLGFTASDLSTLRVNGVVDADFVVAGNTSSTAIMSNPKSEAWNYQSFGVWESGLDTDHGYHGVVSLGARTPDTAIPGSGTANSNFTGKVVGSYITAGGLGNTVLATLNVDVDWGTRSLTLSTSGTQTSPNGADFVANSGLNMAGTLNYLPGTNGFSGTLSTSATTGLTGNSTGQFYGPNAEELGGVFILKSSDPNNTLETYSGAYGAKR